MLIFLVVIRGYLDEDVRKPDVFALVSPDLAPQFSSFRGA